MDALDTPMIDIDLIDVVPGFNPRREFDEDAMDELVASIEQTGITTALTVYPNGKGRFALVAGERRLIAARRRGLKQVPFRIREEEGALAAALAENMIRSDLNPVEEAWALQRLGQLEKLSTPKKIASRVGKSSKFVSSRLAVLTLPEGCYPAVAAGKVPLAAVGNLRSVAKVSPRVAECVCELASREEIGGRAVVTAFADVLTLISQSRFEDAPTMVEPNSIRLRDVVKDETKLAALVEAHREAQPWNRNEDLVVRLGEDEVNAARAARQLIEFKTDHGERTSVARFITDRELAADLAERAIERMVAEAKKRNAEAAALSAANPKSTEEEDKAARIEKREEAKQAKADAERFNEEVGRKLMARRGAAARKDQGLNRAKAVATILLADHDGLAGRGLRLVLPQLREVEHKKLKSGESRQKITYVKRDASSDYLWRKVEEARTEGQVIEMVVEAIVAAALADEAAVAQSNTIHWYSPGREQALKLLAADVKAARPRRRRASR